MRGPSGRSCVSRAEALAALVEHDPGNVGAWDRLGELALLDGQTEAAEGYRKRKAEVNAQRERYKNLIAGDDRARHAEELEMLAGRLGRRLEARGWSLIRQGRAARERLAPEAAATRACRRPGRDPGRPLFRGALERSRPARGRRRAVPGRPALLVSRTTPMPSGLRFVHVNGHSGCEEPAAPRDHVRRRGPARLRRRRLARRLRGPGRAVPSFAIATVYEGDRLFRNRRDGTFEDVTKSAGISAMRRGYGHGVAVADYDNDGHPDLFVTRWRSYALYRNKGDGTFEDATVKAGLGGDRDWPTSAAFADLDGDGDLDLYVCHYLRYDPGNPKRCEHPESPGRHDCDPLDFPSLPDHVFRNDGGRFVDVTAEAGFTDPDGRGLGVVAADLDDDGRTDLYVANDMTANYLFRNLGGFRFEETGQSSGAAASADGGYKAGMGVACGDLDGDGLLDLAVTNYFGESTTFYRNLGQGFFADHSAAMGIAAPTRRLLGFGIAFLDVNNDGWLDLLSANGHILDNRPRYPVVDAAAAPARQPGRASGRRLRDGGAALRPAAPGPGAGRRRPGQRRPAGRPRRRAERAADLPAQPDGRSPAISSGSGSRGRGPTAMPWVRGSRSRARGGSRSASGSAAEATSPAATPGCISVWGPRPGSIRSRSSGRPGESTVMAAWTATGSTSSGKARRRP